ncbi:hypothetical protein [Shewanella baltica]|uniref:hypothetical protein n=1 Tax=Shewanella baltica TaxID=62322 RepID=UPI000674058E|nr:hypothetical protein [Shewanella baltica]
MRQGAPVLEALRVKESERETKMNPKFEVQPKLGIGPIKLGMDRTLAITGMGLKPDSFMKTPMSEHLTDSFYNAGFQIFYEGEIPKVESIELSRGCGFEATISGYNVLDLPVSEALLIIENATGLKPETEDEGYTYEIPGLGLWLWRQSNEPNDKEGLYFSTIGVGTINT